MKIFPVYLLITLFLVQFTWSQKGTALEECRNGRHNNVYYINDRPTHCVIHSTDYRRGMCMPIDLLYETLRTSFNKKTQRDLDADRTREYKRFLLEHRSQIYTPLSQFDDNYFNHWEDGFNTLFIGAAKLFTDTHPETHQVLKNNTGIGVNTFCDLALRQFPVANNRLYNLLPPINCPLPSKTCRLDTGARFASTHLIYPKHVNLVWYTEPTVPAKCYVPAKLSDVNPDPDRCISFQDATDMLNNKDDTSFAWHKNEYLASLLRVYFHPEPGWFDFAYDPYHYTFQRVFRITIGTILKKIDTALGYRDDPDITINITNKYPYQPSMEVVKLSVHSFCAAIVEMIPFRPDEIKAHLTSCS